MDHQIYNQISARTGGDIYIGVVGPVRTGKSTLIKRFMETMVLPGMDNMYKRERARDELPQSGAGRTIMTAEQVCPGGSGRNCIARWRNVSDSSGGLCRLFGRWRIGRHGRRYAAHGFHALREEPMTLAEAAETGTNKVIGEHSTIGLVVTTDGSSPKFHGKTMCLRSSA